MRGFTFIEVMVIIALLALISALSFPFLQTFGVSSDLYTYSNNINQLLRQAQQRSIVGQNSSEWGVYFNDLENKFILFKGITYASRDQDYDRELDYPEIFTVTTDFGDEIYFSLYSGTPSVSGTTTIASVNNETSTIAITSFGLIQVND